MLLNVLHSRPRGPQSPGSSRGTDEVLPWNSPGSTVDQTRFYRGPDQVLRGSTGSCGSVQQAEAVMMMFGLIDEGMRRF